MVIAVIHQMVSLLSQIPILIEKGWLLFIFVKRSNSNQSELQKYFLLLNMTMTAVAIYIRDGTGREAKSVLILSMRENVGYM